MYYSDIQTLDDPTDLLGIDVNVSVYGMFDNPIGFVTAVHEPDTDEPFPSEDYPLRELTCTVQDHFKDREWEISLFDLDPVTVGETYEVSFLEEYTDGEWERVENESWSEGRLHSNSNSNNNTTRRVVTKTYEAAMDNINKFALRVEDGEVTSVPAGRNSLRGALSAVSIDQSIEVTRRNGESFQATVESITPEEIDCNPQSACGTQPEDVPDGYTLNGTDSFGGSITITYSELGDSALLTRTPPESPEDIPENTPDIEDPGELEEELHGLSPAGQPVEHYNIPWLTSVNSAVDIPDDMDGNTSVGLKIGEVYVHEHNPFKLYHVSIENEFRASRSLNHIVTEVEDIHTIAAPST